VEQKGIKIPRIKYYFNTYSTSFNLLISNYVLEKDGMPDIQYLKESETGQICAEIIKITIYKNTCL
jgi:hypothetical protein